MHRRTIRRIRRRLNLILAAAASGLALGPGVEPAQGIPIDWANSAGNSSFTAGPSWVGGIAPGVGDIGVFTNQAIVQQPALAGPASVDGLRFDSTSGAWNLTGAGTLTLGADGMTFTNLDAATARTSTISPSIILGADQTWSSIRGAQNMTAVITGKISGSSNLTIQTSNATGAGNRAEVRLNNAGNDFTGDLIVRVLGSNASTMVNQGNPANPGVTAFEVGGAGATPITPFGTGDLVIQRGMARYRRANNATSATINQDIRFGAAGYADLSLDNRNTTGGTTTWTAGLTRENFGGLVVSYASGQLGDPGNNSRFFITGQAVTDMVSPFIIVGDGTASSRPRFAQYTADGLGRVILATSSVTAAVIDPLGLNNGTEHVQIRDGSRGSTITLGQNIDVKSFSTWNTINRNNGSGFTSITTRSGGLIITGENNVTLQPDLFFIDNLNNPIEAVIWASAGQNYNTGSRTVVTGSITADSLTKLGVLAKHNDGGSGRSMLELSGNNFINGAIRVSDGGLRITNANGVKDHNDIFVGEFADLFLDVNETIAGLSGGGRGTSLNIGNNATRTLTINVAANETFSSAMSIQDRDTNLGQRLALIKDGLGTQILTGDSTFTGLTTINQGELIVHGSLAGDVSVLGGKLGGNGTIDGTVTIHGGATHDVGASPGSQQVGAENWMSGGFFNVQINDFAGAAGQDPGWDLLIVETLLDIQATDANPFTIQLASLDGSNNPGNAQNFNAASLYELLILDAEDINQAQAFNLVFDASAFTNNLLGGFWSLQQRFSQTQRQQYWLVFTPGNTGGGGGPVPEPASISLTLLALGSLGLRRRREV